jgi:hypothetical protein
MDAMEDIMLSEGSQALKQKGHMFSVIRKIDTKDKHIHKTSMSICKLI